jgi:hypothetical protein
LIGMLREAADKLAEWWGQQLAELSVHLIEDPGFRLAGAEESIRQLVATIEQVLQRHEPLAKEITQKAQDTYDCLCAYAAWSGGGRKPAVSVAELQELLRAYPKWRYQSLLLQQMGTAFVGLRGHLSDELREVNFCRVRLGELLRQLEAAPTQTSAMGGPGSKRGGIGKRLFLAGCQGVREGVEQFLDGITPEHLLDLDDRMEAMLEANFTALVHVCLTNANILKDVEASMLQVASDYAAELLPQTSVADLFLEQHPNAEEAEGELARYFDEAAPELSEGRSPRGGPPVRELVLLAAPEGPSSERLQALVATALPAVEVQPAGSAADVLLYRERVNLPLADLDQLGPVARDAYRQMTATENFTPHSRCDIDFEAQ